MIYKLLLAPALIGLVSLAGRRWGPAVSGWLAGLPLTSAPVILFLALDQGTAFASIAAHSTLFGLVSQGGFCLAYSWFSLRAGWPGSILAGWIVFFALTIILVHIVLPLLLSFVVAIACLTIVLILLSGTPNPGVVTNPPPWETPLRMLVAAAFVVGLTGIASLLGPQLSGLLAPFPMFATILAVFTHHYQGAAASRRLLQGVIAGSFTPAVFFLVISLFLWSWGIAAAFGLALLAALLTHGTTFLLMSHFHNT
jgi:hypothetical protein